MISIQKHWLLAILLLGVITTGCGKNSPLRGTVTYEDGTPVTVGTVNFSSGTVLARGTIRSDGSFVVGTLKDADGLPSGEYKVYIQGAEVVIPNSVRNLGVDSMGTPVQSMPAFQQLVDRKYMCENQTPLVCMVPAPGNRFNVVVEKPARLRR